MINLLERVIGLLSQFQTKVVDLITGPVQFDDGILHILNNALLAIISAKVPYAPRLALQVEEVFFFPRGRHHSLDGHV